MILVFNKNIHLIPFEKEGEACFYLKNTKTHSSFTVGMLQKKILSLFDGKRSFNDVYNHLKQENIEITDDQLSGFVSKAVEYDLLINSQFTFPVKKKWYQNLFFHSIFSFSLNQSLANWISKNAGLIGHVIRIYCYAFLPLAIFFLAISFKSNTQEILQKFLSIHLSIYWSVFFMMMVFIIGSILHEFGHWIVYRTFGGQNRRAGFAMINFIPSFYTDVDDSVLFKSKEHRLLTLFGGIASDIGYIFLFYGLFRSAVLGEYSGLAVLAMLFLLIACLFNLNPLLPRSDGYFIFTEIFNIKKLADYGLSVFIYYSSYGKKCQEHKEKSLGYLFYWLLAMTFMIFLFWFFISSLVQLLMDL